MVDAFIPIVSNMRYFIKIITTLFLFKGSCVQLKFNQDLLVLKVIVIATSLYTLPVHHDKESHSVPP